MPHGNMNFSMPRHHPGSPERRAEKELSMVWRTVWAEMGLVLPRWRGGIGRGLSSYSYGWQRRDDFIPCFLLAGLFSHSLNRSPSIRMSSQLYIGSEERWKATIDREKPKPRSPAGLFRTIVFIRAEGMCNAQVAPLMLPLGGPQVPERSKPVTVFGPSALDPSGLHMVAAIKGEAELEAAQWSKGRCTWASFVTTSNNH